MVYVQLVADSYGSRVAMFGTHGSFYEVYPRPASPYLPNTALYNELNRRGIVDHYRQMQYASGEVFTAAAAGDSSVRFRSSFIIGV